MTTSRTEKQEQSEIVIRAFLRFRASEVKALPKEFKSVFRQSGNVTYLIKRISACKKVEYELRYLRHGYNVVSRSADIRQAKAEFLEKAKEAKRVNVSKPFEITEFIESYKQLIKTMEHSLPIIQTIVDEEATASLYARYKEEIQYTGVIL